MGIRERVASHRNLRAALKIHSMDEDKIEDLGY